MSGTAAKLLADVLSLPEGEREELAVRIMDSLEPVIDEGTEAEWDAEILRRVEEIRSGQAKMISWPEALRFITDDTDEPGET